jgi:hypothetical protein
MSSGFAPFCNKISVAIHDFFLSANLRGVHFRILSVMLVLTTGHGRSFCVTGYCRRLPNAMLFCHLLFCLCLPFLKISSTDEISLFKTAP